MSRNSIAKALRRLSSRMGRRPAPEHRPLTPEALLDLRIKHLEKQIDEVKGRVNALMLIILAAVITDLVMRAVT